MNEKYIGRVRIDSRYYSGGDLYSDGIIENEFLEFVKKGVSSGEILRNDDRWPTLYHFSPMRENVVEWYPFNDGAKILEIGSGCGAVTGALCRNKGVRVTCADLSMIRSEICAHRHKNNENVEIFVGDFNVMEFADKFDYITLIGVFEYAAMFTGTSQNPHAEMLKKIAGMLNDGGKLFIAIENKYGLEYWAGSHEDHGGAVFGGLEGYKNKNVAVTFSKPELIKMLNDAEFTDHEFYYPYPDYKLPQMIFSDAHLPKKDDLYIDRYNYDAEKVQLFNEQNVYESLINDGMFGFFSNSFLIVAGRGSAGA